MARLRASSWLVALAAAGLAARQSLAQRADTVVRTASRPLHAGVASLAREISIGIADGDEHYMLGAIADLAVRANGSIYVFDRSVPTIRMYDVAGKYVKTVGAKGQGPGEYLPGAGIAVAKNGNLLMWDPGNARINVYSASGDVVTHWPTLSGGSSTASGRGLLTVDTGGVTYISAHIFSRDPGKRTIMKRGWIRFRADGTLIDTTYAPSFTRPEQLLTGGNADGSSSISIGVPFAPVQYAVLSPFGFFVTGESNRLAIDLHERQGIISIRRSVETRAVSGHDRDSARTDVTARVQRFDPTWSWNGPDIPRTKPAYVGLRVGADGRLWVQLNEGPRPVDASGVPIPPPSSGAGGGRGRSGVSPGQSSCDATGAMLFDVYEPSGAYIGQVQIPERVGMMVMRGDFVWARTCNDEDVPSVVRFRINWK